MSRDNNNPRPTNTTPKGRPGDQPENLIDAAPRQPTPESEDRGRDRSPGDLRRPEQKQELSDPDDLAFEDTPTEEDLAEDETNARTGGHIPNPPH